MGLFSKLFTKSKKSESGLATSGTAEQLIKDLSAAVQAGDFAREMEVKSLIVQQGGRYRGIYEQKGQALPMVEISATADLEDHRVFRDFPTLQRVSNAFRSDPEGCLALCKQQIKSTPDADIPYMWAAICLRQVDRQAEAIQVLMTGLSLCRRKSVLWNELGEIFLEQRLVVEMTRCIVNSVNAQANSPDSHTPYLYLSQIAIGCLQEEVGRQATRIAESIKQNLDLRPDFKNDLRRLAHSHHADIIPLLKLIQWPRVMQERTCLSCRRSYDARRTSCPYCGDSNSSMVGSEALDILQLQLKSKEHNDRGAKFFQEGRLKEAVDELVKAIEINPMHEMAYCNLAYVFIEGGQPQAAIEVLEKVLSINPRREEAHRHMAQARKALGKGLPPTTQALAAQHRAKSEQQQREQIKTSSSRKPSGQYPHSFNSRGICSKCGMSQKFAGAIRLCEVE